MSDPKNAEPVDVSVVIPAYNREDLIGRAVLSVLSQYPRPVAEVIVVDDGSVDSTGDVAERLGAKVIRQPNQGEGPARNTGIAAATSTWIAFLDSDDEWLPQHVQVLLANVREEHVLIGSAARAVPSGRLMGIRDAGGRTLHPADVLWPSQPLVPSATMVRRDVASKLGFRELGTAEDLDFFIRVLEEGPGLVIPDITSVYFEHGGQLSVDNQRLKDGRTGVLKDYRDRTWFPPDLLDKFEASDSWDLFRQAQRDHDWKLAATYAAKLARPKAAMAVKDVLKMRRSGRRG